MLDPLDIKIITMVQKDARIAFADIAKELKVSPGIVQARFNRLKNTGVIIGSTLILDNSRMGIAFITSLGIEAKESELEEVNDYVKGLKIGEAEFFSWITFGRYNIATVIFSKNFLEAYRIMQLVKQHPSVLKVVISITKSLGSNAPDTYNLKPTSNIPAVSLDEIDNQLIRILCKDARTPFNKISKMLGIATETVFKRYRRLQKKGIILGSTVILGTKSLGIKGLCGLYVKLKSGSSISNIKDKLAQNEQPILVHSLVNEYDFYVNLYYRDFAKDKQPIIAHTMLGDYDFYINLYYSNFEEIYDLINNLRKIKEVVGIEL